MKYRQSRKSLSEVEAKCVRGKDTQSRLYKTHRSKEDENKWHRGRNRMGQIANQMVLEMLGKIGRRIKDRKEARDSEKKEKAEEKKSR